MARARGDVGALAVAAVVVAMLCGVALGGLLGDGVQPAVVAALTLAVIMLAVLVVRQAVALRALATAHTDAVAEMRRRVEHAAIRHAWMLCARNGWKFQGVAARLASVDAADARSLREVFGTDAPAPEATAMHELSRDLIALAPELPRALAGPASAAATALVAAAVDLDCLRRCVAREQERARRELDTFEPERVRDDWMVHERHDIKGRPTWDEVVSGRRAAAAEAAVAALKARLRDDLEARTATSDVAAQAAGPSVGPVAETSPPVEGDAEGDSDGSTGAAAATHVQ